MLQIGMQTLSAADAAETKKALDASPEPQETVKSVYRTIQKKYPLQCVRNERVISDCIVPYIENDDP